jgi:hypothetical protein
MVHSLANQLAYLDIQLQSNIMHILVAMNSTFSCKVGLLINKLVHQFHAKCATTTFASRSSSIHSSPAMADKNSSTDTGSTEAIIDNPKAHPPLLGGIGPAPVDPDRNTIPENNTPAPLLQRRSPRKRCAVLPPKGFQTAKGWLQVKSALNRKKEAPKEEAQLQWIQYDGKFWHGKVGKNPKESSL